MSATHCFPPDERLPSTAIPSWRANPHRFSLSCVWAGADAVSRCQCLDVKHAQLSRPSRSLRLLKPTQRWRINSSTLTSKVHYIKGAGVSRLLLGAQQQSSCAKIAPVHKACRVSEMFMRALMPSSVKPRTSSEILLGTTFADRAGDMGGEGADDIHAWIGPVRSHCGSCSHSCLASTRGDVNGDETIKNPPDAAREMGRSDGTTASGASAVPSCDWGAHKRIRPLPNRKLCC